MGHGSTEKELIVHPGFLWQISDISRVFTIVNMPVFICPELIHTPQKGETINHLHYLL